MNDDLKSIKFVLTEQMSIDLINYNKLKKEYIKLKKVYDEESNEDLLFRLNKIEKELNKYKNSFIKNFRLSNKSQIDEYLSKKDL